MFHIPRRKLLTVLAGQERISGVVFVLSATPAEVSGGDVYLLPV
jgi:hypothetical protein